MEKTIQALTDQYTMRPEIWVKDGDDLTQPKLCIMALLSAAAEHLWAVNDHQGWSACCDGSMETVYTAFEEAGIKFDWTKFHELEAYKDADGDMTPNKAQYLFDIARWLSCPDTGGTRFRK